MKVVVLNDGETYTDIMGCVVLEVPDDIEGDDLDYYVQDNYAYGTQVSG